VGGSAPPGNPLRRLAAIAFSAPRDHLLQRIVADILVTGATGFVGSHFVEALARHGMEARALVRPTSDVSVLRRCGIEPVVCGLDDPAGLRQAVADAATVVHAAAATRALARTTFHDVNVEGTRRLVDAMTADGGARRLVYLSSLSAAGPAEAGGGPVGPLTTYGRTKLEGERIALGQEGLRAIVLRPPAVYGPRDTDLLPFFRLARRGILPVVGRAERRLQMIHARDLAEAMVLAVRRPGATGVYAVADPTVYAWAEVLDMVGAAVGRRGWKVPLPTAALTMVALATQAAARLTRRPATLDREKVLELLADGWVCDTEAAREDLGFAATTSLAEGLRETVDWYRAEGLL
jgi:dihydroflavonol-4-reductase